MLYRVSGILFTLFGCSLIYGHLSANEQPKIGEQTFATQYNGLLTGVALFAAGLYLIFKRRNERA